MSDKTELELLKERATKMGISYSPNIGVDALKKKIDAELTPQKPDEPEDEAMKARLALSRKRQAAKKEADSLVRIRLTCMNPAKKDWPGEIITVSNKLVGTQKKFIPFTGAEDGYHVTRMMLNTLKARKFQQFKTVKLPNGQTTRQGSLVSEFAIEELPPLTEAELKELAKAQAAAGL